MTPQPGGTRQLWFTGVSVAVATAITITVRFGDWYGSWGETGRAIEDSTTLTYPLIAGIAAWVASAPKRRRYAWMVNSASRTATELGARTALRIAAPAALGALLAATVALVVTGSEATYAAPPVAQMAPVLAGFAAATCFGLLLAGFLPSFFSPVVAVVTIYAVEVFLDTGDPSLRTFAGLTVADPRERTYRGTETWMLEVRALWLIALAWLLFVIASKVTTRWLVPFGAVCILAVPLLLVGDTGMKVDEAATRAVCHEVEERAQVCLSAARDHVHEELADAIIPVISLLEGMEGKRWVFDEESIASSPEPQHSDSDLSVPFAVVHGNSGNAHVVDERRFQADIGRRLFGKCPNTSANSEQRPYATIQDVILGWYLTKLDIPVDGSDGYSFPDLSEDLYDYAKVTDFQIYWTDLSHDARLNWFTAHSAALLDCTLQLTEAVKQ